MSEFENHKTFYGSGSDEYNFDIHVMEDSGKLIKLVEQSKECDGEIQNGAVLVITEKQYIMAYNYGDGYGPHDAALARVFSAITDQKELNYFTVMHYCHKAEKVVLHARVYAERTSKYSDISKIFAFSFNRERKISQEEFNSFMDFYNEYAWAIKREKFKVSLMGKSMEIDDVKNVLESMVDPNFHMPPLCDGEETLIGVETNKEENKIIK